MPWRNPRTNHVLNPRRPWPKPRVRKTELGNALHIAMGGRHRFAPNPQSRVRSPGRPRDDKSPPRVGSGAAHREAVRVKSSQAASMSTTAVK
jgi:hypothetical protein